MSSKRHATVDTAAANSNNNNANTNHASRDPAAPSSSSSSSSSPSVVAVPFVSPRSGTDLAATGLEMNVFDVLGSCIVSSLAVFIGHYLYLYLGPHMASWLIITIAAFCYRFFIKWTRLQTRRVADGATDELAQRLDNWKKRSWLKAKLLSAAGVDLDAALAAVNKLAQKKLGPRMHQQ